MDTKDNCFGADLDRQLYNGETEELRAASLAADITADEFHATFDENVRDIMEPVREALLEGSGTCGLEEIIAQVMMENLFPHLCDPELGQGDSPDTKMTAEQKKFLVGVASHMGPDWAQALYHAAVFITKVA